MDNFHNYKQILDNIDMDIYVTKLDTYELIYINQRTHGRSVFQEENLIGRLCYEALMGFKEPCPFCKIKKLKKNDMLTREFFYPRTSRILKLRGTIINWDDEIAHIEYIEDITKEKKATHENEKLKIQLNNVIEKVPSGICVYNYDGKKLSPIHHNERFYDILGYSAEHRKEVEEKTDNLNVHPDDVEKVNKAIYSIVDNGGKTQISYRLYNDKKQEYIILQLTCNCEKHSDSTATLYVQYEDITELEELRSKRIDELNLLNTLEHKMVKEENNLIATVKCNLNKDIIISHDPGILSRSSIADGTSIEEFVDCISHYATGNGESNIIRERFSLENLKRTKSKGQSISYEYHLTDRKGNLLIVKEVAYFMTSPLDGDDYAMLYCYDITQSKRREKVLRKIIQNNFDHITVVDIKKDEIIQMYDKSFDTSTSIFDDEFDYKIKIGMSFSNVAKEFLKLGCSEEEYDEVLNMHSYDTICKKLENDTIYTVANTLYDAEKKKYIRKMWQYSYFDISETQLICCRIDTTSVYEKERLIKKDLQDAMNRAKDANRAKTEFLSRVSHDMRTPMNGIIGLTNICLDDFEVEKDLRENLEQILLSSEYLLNLINDTLEMNKIDSNNITLNITKSSPKNILDNILRIVSINAEKKNIKMVVNIKVKKWHLLKMDILREEQIWLNILSNAIKFTPENGKIEIDLENIEEGNNRSVTKFVIKDNGIGMSEEFLPKVFEPFAQEHSVDNKYGGTGLGLSIVKRLVELMGGTISVESKLGVGTSFTCITPFEWADGEVESESEVISPNDLAGVRVLMCEDHPINQKVAKNMLEKCGMIVDIANNGSEGVRIFADSSQNYYSIIMMDIRMPILDGYEATKQIRNMDRSDAKTIPIIAMTANAFDEDVTKSYEVGMNAHIAKPIDKQLLHSTLNKLLKK